MEAAQAIRRIRTRCTGYLRTLAVGLANRLRMVTRMVLTNMRPAAWFAVRLNGIQLYTKEVHTKCYIPLE